MKRTIQIFGLVVILMLASELVNAQNRGIGLGAALGGPDGLSYKSWMGETTALSGLVAFSISENNSNFYTHLDFLSHKFYDELNWDVGRLYYYYGGGLAFEWREPNNDNIFTLRLPSGFGFNFDDVPLGLFFELAASFNVNPAFSFYFNGNFGFRYYLN